MEQEFFDFLKNGSISKTFYYGDSQVLVNKVRYNDKLDILYALNNYKGKKFDLYSSFKYSGIYDKENNKLFDVEYSLRYNILKWEYNDERYISSDDLFKTINQDMNEKIKQLVEDGKEDIFDISEVELAKEIDESDVQNEFMDGITSKTLEPVFDEYSTLKAADLLDYLTNKEEFLEIEARDFIISNMRDILKKLAITEEKKKVLKSIEDNKEHPYHKIKEIVDTVSENNCITVNLTINKEGKEQVFKYDANTLLTYYKYSYLPTNSIENWKDRNLFEETFGRNVDLHYEDIIKITYGKKTIYEDLNFKSLDFKEEDVLTR